MNRSLLSRNLARAIRIALYCNQQRISTSAGIEKFMAIEAQQKQQSRREFLTFAATSTLGAIALGQLEPTFAAPPTRSDIKVGIVGVGLAGLSCAYELQKKGISATLYDANTRIGGRCFSLGGSFAGPVTFPGQVVERGGEFIDNLHKTLIGYARQFKLQLEDVTKQPGEIFYYFNGQRYPESAVVDEFRNFVAAMRADLRTLSQAPSADNHTDADIRLDRTSLLEYLETRQAGTLLKAAIKAAYMAEYGLELDQQSCLNFLLFIHADKRSKFTPFGVFSDERYHVIGGNQQIVEGLKNQLSGSIHLGRQLVRVRQTSTNQIELTFKEGSKTTSTQLDAVVLAIPFTVLRQVELDSSLGLPDWKLAAINQLGYGNNAKMMVGFQGRPWLALGSDGSSYSDLPNHQTSWETNPSQATNTHAVLTDYASGDRCLRLNPKQVPTEVSRFLNDLDRVYPGVSAAVARDRGNVRAYLEHWPSQPLFQGSYTCYKPGQFTTIAGHEGKPIGNLYFAGEHTNSFYEWQGFMEGAALSGILAAQQILQRLKVRT